MVHASGRVLLAAEKMGDGGIEALRLLDVGEMRGIEAQFLRAGDFPSQNFAVPRPGKGGIPVAPNHKRGHSDSVEHFTMIHVTDG